MNNAKRNSSLGRLLAAGALATGAMFAANGAMACTTDNWTAVTNATAGDPTIAGGEISRYQGLCGLEVTGTGYVQDDSPNGIDRIVARFYVLNDNTAEATIYRGFSANDGTGELFNITLDDAGLVTFTDLASGQSVSQSGATDWLSVEVDWVRDANGSITLSVNGQAEETASVDNSSAAQLASVRLGNLDGAAGTVGFDSYESRRSTAVGRVCNCNANGSADDVVSVQDVIDLVNEAGGGNLASGTPDCNEDGQVSVQDIILTVNIAGDTGACVL